MTTMASFENVVAWCAQMAALAGAALVLLRVLRLDAPAVRYTALRLVLAACLCLPILQTPVPPDPTASAPQTTVRVEARGGHPTRETAPAASPWWQTPESWASFLLTLAATGMSVRLIWVAAGIVRLRRLRRAGLAATGIDEHDELAALIGARPEIRFVEGLGQPVTFGARRPIVLLPENLRAQPSAIRRGVIAHEIWHVKRRDWIWTVAEELVRAAFWFHPLVWILVSHIQWAREEVVDELTIMTIGSRRSYADALIAYCDRPPLSAATAFARRRHLVYRMALISKEAVMSARRVVASCAALVVGVAMAGWSAAAAFPLEQQSGSQILVDNAGPVERRAKPLTPENPIPPRTYSVPADYPREAEAIGARGTINVTITLDETGTVVEARPIGFALRRGDTHVTVSNAVGVEGVLRSASPSAQSLAAQRAALEAMVAAATRAVRQWHYRPPADGPIAFTVGVPVDPSPVTQATAVPPPTTLAGGWEMSQGALRVGGGIKAPMKVVHVNPVYPPIAQSARVQGVVIVEARLEGDGSVGAARVLRSIPLLDEAALDAVRQWRFTPTLMNGVPTPVIMTLTVNFVLQQ